MIPMILFKKNMLKTVIHITVLLSMLQELSWINMIPSAEQKSVIFANFNETIMRYQYLVIIIIIGNICVYWNCYVHNFFTSLFSCLKTLFHKTCIV